MKNYDLSKLPNGQFTASLRDGVHIGADADTPEQAVDALIGYLRDLHNGCLTKLNVDRQSCEAHANG
jgi:hypothetical protein